MAEGLPCLREDLRVVRGMDDYNGWPTYVLHDPFRSRYFRLGWREFEIVSRWGLGDADSILISLGVETSLDVERSHVEAVARFIQANGLARVSDDLGLERLSKSFHAARLDWASWLLHNYLFIRLPLVRADGIISRMETFLRPALGHAPILITGLWIPALVILATRFDEFLSTYPHTATPAGLAIFLAALGLSKVFHELGHAIVLKRYGGAIPTMGVALVVLAPMLYTDTSSGWFLTSRHQRVWVALAGIVTEIALAGMAVILWSVLPDGPARTSAFFIATAAVVGTLAVNASPFLKFDGYYVLADLLNIPNLHDRAFSLARRHLRRLIFLGIDDSAAGLPVPYSRTLIGYAYATWLYRLIVFAGIAVMVYSFAFKALGIVLFAVEIWWFIARPAVREVVAWKTEKLKPGPIMKIIHATLLATAILLLVVPWRSTVTAPAVVNAAPYHRLVAASAGVVVDFALSEGKTVRRGDALYAIDEADVRQHRLAARFDTQEAVARAERAQVSEPHRAETFLATEQVTRAREDVRGAAERGARSVVSAPIDGTVRDMGDGLRVGRWIAKDTPIAIIAGNGLQVIAFVDERSVRLVSPGAEARFIPSDPTGSRIRLRVAEIGDTAIGTLEIPVLASANGGPIPVWQDAERKRLVPAESVFRVVLVRDQGEASTSLVMPGTVEIEGKSRPIIIGILSWMLAGLGAELSF